MAGRGSSAHASRAGRGICKCADSEAISLLYHSAWQYGAGAQDSDGGDWCQMSAISSFSRSLFSLHAQIHMRTLQHWLSVPFGKPKLFAFVAWGALSIYLLLHWNCQIQKPRGNLRRVPAPLAEGRCLLQLLSFLTHSFHSHSLPLSINVNVTWGTACIYLCVCVCALQIPAPFAIAANWLFASHHSAWLHAPPPPPP